jgi:dsRNA-specific ribonuclease
VSEVRVDTSPLPELEGALGVRFTDADLRRTALTHRSYAFERGETVTN